MRRLFDRPYLLLTLTALFWAGNMVIGRSVREGVPPIGLAFWRWALAFLLILPFALPHWRTQWRALLAGWKPVVFLGALGVGGYNTFAYLALQYTTAINATMLNSLIPVATILLARFMIGRRMHQLEGLGVLVSLLGVSVIVSRGHLETLLGLQLNSGDFWMLLAVLDWGLYTVALHWRPKGVDPMLMLCAMTVVGVMILGPLWTWEMSQGKFIQPGAANFAAIAYTAIFPGFLGYVFYNRGVVMVGPNRGSLFIHLMPAFGTVLSMIFLNENPKAFHAAGIGLILCGIWMTTRVKHSG